MTDKCDLCGKNCAAHDLRELYPCYPTESIEKVCLECSLETRDHLEWLNILRKKWCTRMFKKYLINKKREYGRAQIRSN